MGLECELKYVGVDLMRLSSRLDQGGGELVGRYFESNLVFDRSDRSLKAAGVLLRLRFRQGQAVLTVKRPPTVALVPTLKVFEEIETPVGDFKVMREALEAIGFSVAFTYEKVREKWRHMGCVVCLDHLPFGDFVEIEGGETSVPACASRLDLDPTRSTTATYHALNLAHREARGLAADENFVFSDDEKAAFEYEIGKV
jgi:adenylate cyclase class 2